LIYPDFDQESSRSRSTITTTRQSGKEEKSIMKIRQSTKLTLMAILLMSTLMHTTMADKQRMSKSLLTRLADLLQKTKYIWIKIPYINHILSSLCKVLNIFGMFDTVMAEDDDGILIDYEENSSRIPIITTTEAEGILGKKKR
jgi:hypothetical protein